MHARPGQRLSAVALSIIVGLAAGAAVWVASPGPAAHAAVRDPALAGKLASVMADKRVAGARSGAVVIDAASGSELYARYAGRATTPASNTKIVTAAAALHTLGPSYRFKTQVITRGRLAGGVLHGRLYLKGYGDPTTRQADYASLAGQVRSAGVRTVDGSLIVDATYFDQIRYNPRWSTGYAAAYYAAETSALTVAPNADLDSGTVVVSYRAGAPGKRAKISFRPAAAARYVAVVNKTTTAARGTSTTFAASRRHGSNTIVVSGRVPRGRSGERLITVHRPELYAAAVFRVELAKAGVSVRGETKTLATPASRRIVLATDTSMTLAQLLVPFMKLSNNMHAEALTKAMGAKTTGVGSWSSGLRSTRGYLQRVGAPMSGVALDDGSGLSRGNTLTARALGRLLWRARSEPWFGALYASLPVAGNTARMTGGTLRYRMNGTRAADNARAKTGTLTGVTALSGYVRGRDGRLYVFAMLSQHRGPSPRPVEDTLVVTLANWRR